MYTRKPCVFFGELWEVLKRTGWISETAVKEAICSGKSGEVAYACSKSNRPRVNDFVKILSSTLNAMFTKYLQRRISDVIPPCRIYS